MTGVARAEERVATLFDRLARTNLNVVVAHRRTAARAAALERARDAAIAAGRVELLEYATTAARESVLRSFSRSGFTGTWAVTDWNVSVANAEDRIAAAEAFEEAATAAVAEDLLDPETVELLQGSAAQLASLSQLPAAGSLSEFSLGTLAGRGPVRALFGVLFLVLVIGGLVVGPAGAILIILATMVAIAVAAGRERR